MIWQVKVGTPKMCACNLITPITIVPVTIIYCTGFFVVTGHQLGTRSMQVHVGAVRVQKAHFVLDLSTLHGPRSSLKRSQERNMQREFICPHPRLPNFIFVDP